MYCLKCGRDSIDNRVFCGSCLDGMAQFPVKSDTAVNLPHRETPPPVKKQVPRKRPQAPEEQVAQLRKRIRRLTVLLAVLALMLSLTTAILLKEHFGDGLSPVIGRNYTIDTTHQP